MTKLISGKLGRSEKLTVSRPAEPLPARATTGRDPFQQSAGSIDESRLRRALFRRMGRQIRTSLQSMSVSDLVELVELETPVETLAQVVSMNPEAVLSVGDDYAVRLLRGARRKQELVQRLGGALSSGEVAEVLGITVPAVKQRVRRGKLLALPLSNGEWGFPALQFTPDGQVRDGLPDVLAAFDAGEDPWAILLVLAADAPDGREGTLLEDLGNERTRRIAVDRARGFGAQGAA